MVRPSEVRFPRIGELSPFHQLLDVHGMDFAMVASREQRNEKQRQGVQFSQHTVCFFTMMEVPGGLAKSSAALGDLVSSAPVTARPLDCRNWLNQT